MTIFKSRHNLVATRVGLDEVHITCKGCEFKYEIALLINGQYDKDSGMLVERGVAAQHNLRGMLNATPPGGPYVQ